MPSFSLSDQVLDNQLAPDAFIRRGKPRWLRAQLPKGPKYAELARMIRGNELHTVCQEARCPNMGECWSAGVATVMILGDTCTRSCGFCHIKTGKPPVLDREEPKRVAESVRLMGLRYVVITSVDRDELPDGGAGIWAETIDRVHQACPDTQIEVLIPDFQGDEAALDTVLDAKPDVLAHNLETVRRLHRAVRPQARYDRSLEVLARARRRGFVTKTGIMVGIGETDDEVRALIGDLVKPIDGPTGSAPANVCEILTIGQYLQPSPAQLPVARFVSPEQFAEYKAFGEALGLAHVESGPMVRSSYRADQQFAATQ